MKGLLEYSILRYIPSSISGEAINLGMVFVDTESGARDFYYTKKLKRVLEFDDTIDKNNIEFLLSSIQTDVRGHVYSNSDFNIEDFVRFYCNQYRFDKPQKLMYDDFEEQILNLKKTYFRFDFRKAERPTADDDRKMLRQMLETRFDGLKKDQVVIGTADESIRFDYTVGDYKIKFLDFSNKKIKNMINTIKAWSWNCMQDEKIYLVYRYDDMADENQKKDFEIAMKVLKKAGSNVCPVEKMSDSLQNISA